MSKTGDDSEKVRWWPFWLILSFVVTFWLVFVMDLSKNGTEFGVLVKKYDFFDDMPSGALIDEEHRKFYAPSAYGDMVPEGE